jgi:hypothetical protein
MKKIKIKNQERFLLNVVQSLCKRLISIILPELKLVEFYSHPLFFDKVHCIVDSKQNKKCAFENNVSLSLVSWNKSERK